MENAIRELEEKRSHYQEQLREIRRELKNLDQALAQLRGSDQRTASPECEEPESGGAHLSARTPWP